MIDLLFRKASDPTFRNNRICLLGSLFLARICLINQAETGATSTGIANECKLLPISCFEQICCDRQLQLHDVLCTNVRCTFKRGRLSIDECHLEDLTLNQGNQL